MFIEENTAACLLVDNIYLFFEKSTKRFKVYAQLKDNGIYTPLTSAYKIKIDKITTIYDDKSKFFKELKAVLENFDVDIETVREEIREAIKEITNNIVELTEQPEVTSSRKTEEDDEKYVLNLDADVHGTIRPADTIFNSPDDYIILEACWLPYTHVEKGTTKLMPTLIVKTPDKLKLARYREGMNEEGYFVSGAFPDKTFVTLMTIGGVKNLQHVTPELVERYIKDIDVELDEMLDRHLEIGAVKKVLLKRFIQGTYFYQIMNSYAILNIMGPSESGKTRAGLCIASAGYHGEPTLNVTEAGIFRAKEELKPTLIVDEAEYLSDEGYKRIKLLLNASYSKGLGYVHRYDDVGGAKVRVAFDLYSPFVIIAINPLTGITASRSIAVSMTRTDKDMPRATPYAYRHLRDKLYTLKLFISDRVWEIYHSLDISEYVSARFDELFRPLFVLTEIFGTEEESKMIGEWANRYQRNFRVSAMNVTQERDLLMVIWSLLKNPEKFTLINGDEYILLKDIANEMATMFGQRFHSNKISNMLRSLGYEDRKICTEAGSKGYALARLVSDDVKKTMIRYGIEIDG